MVRPRSTRALNYALVLTTALFVSSTVNIKQSQALTASQGRPYHGRLDNGVVFPNQFPGYHLRDANRAYTTPEVVGAMLDAIEAVRTEFPDTCDLFLGDFSTPGGGSANHHRSHQNGRDVDVGMYFKGNRPLTTFASMSEDNLDVAKTWCFIENIIRSQRVQYIFLDRRVQKPLYDYAVTRGYDQAYLERVFGNVRGALLQHVRNHSDHMHIRFFTPWSTLAAHIDSDEADKRMVIEMAQQSYLPKRVNYYVNGSEKDLDQLARSFGVTKRDLCKWNNLNPSGVLVPGSCLVFYKRSFESEPVTLARSLQPGFIPEAPAVRVAALRSEAPKPSVTDGSTAALEPDVQQEKDTERHASSESGARIHTARRSAGKMYADSGKVATDATKKKKSSGICFTSDPKKPDSTAAYYTVNKGGTLLDVAKKTGIPISSLSQLNGLNRNAKLKAGQKIKLTQASLPVKPSLGSAECAVGSTGKKSAVKKNQPEQKSDKRKIAGPAEAKAAKKASDKSATSKSKTPDKVAGAKKAPVKQSAAKGNAKAAPPAKTASKPSTRKPAVKEKAKTSKPAPATAQKKAADLKIAAPKPSLKGSAQPAGQLARAVARR
ncbi:MAG: penicillin-insensitive murein endopeptidase [Syntrophobacteraceae bacterium]